MKLFRPRVNFGGKQKVDMQNFIPEGHPNVHTVQDVMQISDTNPSREFLCISGII